MIKREDLIILVLTLAAPRSLTGPQLQAAVFLVQLLLWDQIEGPKYEFVWLEDEPNP